MLWPDTLSVVLCSMHVTHNKEIGLSPCVIITGRPMSLPDNIDFVFDFLLKDCIQLTCCAVRTEGHEWGLETVTRGRTRPCKLHSCLDNVLVTKPSGWHYNLMGKAVGGSVGYQLCS